MNSYALYMAGVYLEPMLGKTKYIIAYLVTGIFASLASLWWHSEGKMVQVPPAPSLVCMEFFVLCFLLILSQNK
jgi:membrane associated rhomboid family serine protease